MLNPVLQSIINQIANTDPNRSTDGALKLVASLERSNYADSAGNPLIHFPDIDSVQVTDDEQREVALVLSHLIREQHHLPGSLFWILGKVKPAIVRDPLLEVLTECATHFDEETAYQALIALENCSESEVIQGSEICAVLERLAQSERSGEVAERLRKQMRCP